ncbi:MAG: D-3-phosphoglycerate dehydrogenase [Verrucomicrobiales bacterium]|jgi:D-3-phosphoglycerate dehydrogenase
MRILCADALADDLLSPLRDAGHDVLVEADLNADTIPARLAELPVDVLVVRSTKVTAEAIKSSESLGLIVRAGAGTDNVDKDAASARGVYVSNVPGQNAIAVAELAMGLLLAIDRHIASGMADLTAGRWNKGRYSKADGIYGKTIAIIGLGEIGFALAERANGFGMMVVALRKPNRSTASLTRLRAAGIHLVDTMDELLASADVVSLHVPKSADTKGMVNADFLSKLKDGAIVLNTSRGEVVDAEALIAAMDTRGIRAGLDVWPDEPSGKAGEWTSPLSLHPNVVGSHHIGASTQQAQDAVAAGTVAVIEGYVQGRITNCVNMVGDLASCVVLTVRHYDRVGVLAKVFQTLRTAGLNVQQMENQLFSGSVAAVASINLENEPSTDVMATILADDDILAVSASSKAR